MSDQGADDDDDDSRTERKRGRSSLGAGASASTPGKGDRTSMACLQCQHSHVTCSDQRPCERCAKRGLQCVDGVRKKAKYLDILSQINADSKPDPAASNAAVALSAASLDQAQTMVHQQQTQVPQQMQPPLDFAPSMHQAASADTASLQQQIAAAVVQAQQAQQVHQQLQQPSPQQSQQNQPPPPPQAAPFGGFGSESINSEYSFLSNMLDNSNVSTHATHLQLHSHQALDAGLLPPHQQAQPTGVMLDMQRSDVLVKKAKRVYRDVVRPYDYREGYHYLVKYIAERMEKTDIMRICSSLAKFRPSFMAVMMNLSEEDLVFMEKCFQRTLIEYEKLITYSGTPTVVWRRSGEICLVGKEFCLLTDWPLETLLPTSPAQQSTYIYQLMDAKSVIEYWDRFATAAFDNANSSWMVRSVLVSPGGKQIACSVCFTIKRDIFDVPLAIIGNFLPLFQPRKSQEAASS
ncbi:hypothetical protein BC830DRAFT_1163318 [Chytriomyces sp. MP71]|nr:hypothetical protein BC830DRAFT_1163318 [Chytriomyces sp. MP71]